MLEWAHALPVVAVDDIGESVGRRRLDDQHAAVGQHPPALFEHGERLEEVLDDVVQEDDVKAAGGQPEVAEVAAVELDAVGRLGRRTDVGRRLDALGGEPEVAGRSHGAAVRRADVEEPAGRGEREHVALQLAEAVAVVVLRPFGERRRADAEAVLGPVRLAVEVGDGRLGEARTDEEVAALVTRPQVDAVDRRGVGRRGRRPAQDAGDVVPSILRPEAIDDVVAALAVLLGQLGDVEPGGHDVGHRGHLPSAGTRAGGRRVRPSRSSISASRRRIVEPVTAGPWVRRM